MGQIFVPVPSHADTQEEQLVGAELKSVHVCQLFHLIDI